jgi:hypothetical protein
MFKLSVFRYKNRVLAHKFKPRDASRTTGTSECDTGGNKIGELISQ